MRLPVKQILAFACAGTLAACGTAGHNAQAIGAMPGPQQNGPAADYPMVLGDAFIVDGVSYKPVDVMNYDTVGYAGVEVGAGEREGVTIAHRTLPLPSYAEVTSLESGRTILVRVERRGPMTGARLIDLSPAAAAQLGVNGAHSPIRIRRVNPPEQERALLRGGEAVPPRMDTPKSLGAVLRRKLEPDFVAVAVPLPTPVPTVAAAPVKAAQAKVPVVKAVKAAAPAQPAPKPVTVPTKAPAPTPATTAPKEHSGTLIVQVGAFSTEQRGRTAAAKVGGNVSAAGKFHRVRMGPFATRGQAEAALAKAKAAGYSDARIQRAD
ncbi:MAG: SPOR domain-containing protein [Novosphingobium sp.]